MVDADASYADHVRRHPEVVVLEPEEALGLIAPAGRAPGHVESWPGISPFVVPTVLWSLYCFLRTPDNYYASIWWSIATGGDVDTTAAITGAVSGAFNGRAVLPEHLLAQLHDHGEWRLDDLNGLCAEACEQFRTA